MSWAEFLRQRRNCIMEMHRQGKSYQDILAALNLVDYAHVERIVVAHAAMSDAELGLNTTMRWP